MTTYEDELAGLPRAFAAATAAPETELLRSARELLSSGPMYAVASGGAVVAAEFAARLHNSLRPTPALSLSPLEFVQRAASMEPGTVVLFSARARHPDTALAAKVAMDMGYRVVLVTQRASADLDATFQSPLVEVVTVPAPDGSDGFLATQSVLIMCTVTARICGAELDSGLLALTGDLPQLGSRVIVVHGVDESAAALDVEVRLHELGLATVQLADYRNFAHGRHVGLYRHRAETTVLFLVSPGTRALADRTQAVLPEEIHVAELSTERESPSGALELLVKAMRLPLVYAAAQEISPHRPPVPDFGRALYHLPFKRTVTVSPVDAVARKMRAAGLRTDELRPSYVEAYSAWRGGQLRADLGGVLLDYDGTCLETKHRWALPPDDVQRVLITLLERGLTVAFASGRGGSLHRDLRAWVPKQYWGQVALGLRNGSLPAKLSEVMPNAESDAGMTEFRQLLAPFESAGVLQVKQSGSQLSLTSSKLPVSSIRDYVETVAARPSSLQIRVQASAHSVDVIPAWAGKDRFLATLAEQLGRDVLAIGDQGSLGGNDFAMLAATTHSVSVDRCSADPTRCWNVFPASQSGPRSLVRVLDLLVDRRGRVAFAAPALRR